MSLPLHYMGISNYLKLMVPNMLEYSQFWVFFLTSCYSWSYMQEKIWPSQAKEIPVLSIVYKLWPPELSLSLIHFDTPRVDVGMTIQP